MMINVRLSSITLLLAPLCMVAPGCNDATTTTSRKDAASDRDVTVTVRKPVLSGDQTNENPTSPDRTNTGVNVRDRDYATKTPLDQNENKADIKITADIRSRVVDTEMSVDAQNVKIITQDGKVTLRGPVHTVAEKANVEKIAMDVAGKDNVLSQLEIDAD